MNDKCKYCGRWTAPNCGCVGQIREDNAKLRKIAWELSELIEMCVGKNGHLEGYIYGEDPESDAFVNQLRDKWRRLAGEMYASLKDIQHETNCPVKKARAIRAEIKKELGEL